jgi:hypothetical protein
MREFSADFISEKTKDSYGKNEAPMVDVPALVLLSAEHSFTERAMLKGA